MKTVEHLRKFIKENEGELVLGQMSIKYDGFDVDIFIGDEIFQWISKIVDDEKSLSDITVFSGTNDYKELKKNSEDSLKKIRELQEENTTLKQENKVLSAKNTVQEFGILTGKIEVYEKLFTNTSLTIQK